MKRVVGFWGAALTCVAAAAGCGGGGDGMVLTVRIDRGGLDLRSVEVVVVSADLGGGETLECADFGGEVGLDDEGLTTMARTLLESADSNEVNVAGLDSGWYVALARGRDVSCMVVAEGCTSVLVSSSITTTVSLEAVSGGMRCGESRGCVDGVCGACTEDLQCEDGDYCTGDTCEDGVCVLTPGMGDRDEDGAVAPECGGDDCDDADAAIHPGADRVCGFALDHDCDGQVDDVQGCESCSGATGLERIGTIETPAVALSAIGTPPGGGSQQLFVGTPESLDVYEVAEDGMPTLLGSTPYEGALPLAPAVIGEHVLVVDQGSSGLWVYETNALREGDAEPVTRLDEVALGVGQVTAFASGTQYAYLSLSAGGGALASLNLSRLPTIVPSQDLERVLDSGEWRDSDALALDTGEGGGLFGVLGGELSYVGLDVSGRVLAGTADLSEITDGFGTDIDLLPDWVLQARGNGGAIMIDRPTIEAGSCCESSDIHSLALPVGCDEAPVCGADGVCNCRCGQGNDPDCTVTFGCGDDGVCNLDCPRAQECDPVAADPGCPLGSDCACECTIDPDNCVGEACCTEAACAGDTFPDHCRNLDDCACAYDPDCESTCGCSKTNNVAIVDESRAIVATDSGSFDEPGVSSDVAPIRVRVVDISDPAAMSVLGVLDLDHFGPHDKPVQAIVVGDFVYLAIIDRYYNSISGQSCEEGEPPCRYGAECRCDGGACSCSYTGSVEIFRLTCP